MDNVEILDLLAFSAHATAIYQTEEIIIRYANDAMIEFWGKDRSVVGKPLEDAIPELRGQPFKGLLQEVLKTGVTTWGHSVPAQLFVGGELQTFYYDYEYRAMKNAEGDTYAILHTATDVSEKVKAQFREKQTRDTLQLALEAAHFGTWYLNSETRELVADARLKELFGFLPSENISLSMFINQITEDHRTKVANSIEHVLINGGAYDLSYSVKGFHDQKLRWVRALGSLMADDKGNLTVFTGTVMDITEQVLARREVQQLNEQLSIVNENMRNIILQAPIAMAMFSRENLIIEQVNNAFLQLWNRDRSVIGKPLTDALPELRHQPFPQIMMDVIQTGITYQATEAVVYLQRHGELQEGYFNFINQAFRNNEGKIIGLIVIANEVTEEVRVRKEQDKVHEQAKLSKEAAEMGTFDLDLIKGTMHWDLRCRELFGTNHQNELNYEKDFVGGLHPEDRNRVLAVIDRCFHDPKLNGYYDIEYRTIGALDQKLRWVKAKGRVYFGEEGKPVRFIGSVLDITEQKLNEIRKGDFIGMVSHELKTPLTSLSAIIQVAEHKLKNSEDPFIASAMQKAGVQVNRMKSMISGFLDISRLEFADIRLQKTRFNLGQLVQDVIDETELTVASHPIECTDGHSITVFADRDKISSVITNLINNAIKYSPKGHDVHVACELSGQMAIVSVRDQGIGINAQDLEKIFDRYYRVESFQTQYISGFGIGLYLSAEIIQRHNGRIWAESIMGSGSTFYFSLPVTA